MDDATDFVKARIEANLSRDLIVAEFLAWNQNRADLAGLSETSVRQYMMANPLEMSVDGIMRYWHKRLVD
jgi:hypothetical protein